MYESDTTSKQHLDALLTDPCQDRHQSSTVTNHLGCNLDHRSTEKDILSFHVRGLGGRVYAMSVHDAGPSLSFPLGIKLSHYCHKNVWLPKILTKPPVGAMVHSQIPIVRRVLPSLMSLQWQFGIAVQHDIQRHAKAFHFESSSCRSQRCLCYHHCLIVGNTLSTIFATSKNPY